MVKKNKGRQTLLSKCAMWDSKKSRFIKDRKAEVLSSKLELKRSFCKILLLGDILFYRYKANEIIIKSLLAGDKFMPEMHFIQTGFTSIAFWPFNKHKERIWRFKETGDSGYIYQNKLDKACF